MAAASRLVGVQVEMRQCAPASPVGGLKQPLCHLSNYMVKNGNISKNTSEFFQVFVDLRGKYLETVYSEFGIRESVLCVIWGRR